MIERAPGFYWLQSEKGPLTVGEWHPPDDSGDNAYGYWSVIGSENPHEENHGFVYWNIDEERFTIGTRIVVP